MSRVALRAWVDRWYSLCSFWLGMFAVVLLIQLFFTLFDLNSLSLLSQAPSGADSWLIKSFALIPQFAAAFLFWLWRELRLESHQTVKSPLRRSS